MTATQTRRTADRLSYAAFALPECRVLVEVTERRPRAGDRVTRYVVEEVQGEPDTYLIAKHESETGERCEDVYEVRGRSFCSCIGSATRHQQADCRHRAMVRFICEGEV